MRDRIDKTLDALPLEKLADPKVQQAVLKGGSLVAWHIAKRHPIGRAALMARRGAKLVGAVKKARAGSKLP